MVGVWLVGIIGGIIGAYGGSGGGSKVDLCTPFGFQMGFFTGVTSATAWNYAWYLIGLTPTLQLSLVAS